MQGVHTVPCYTMVVMISAKFTYMLPPQKFQNKPNCMISKFHFVIRKLLMIFLGDQQHVRCCVTGKIQ